MNHKIQRIFAQLFPYVLVGIAISMAVGILIMLSCILMWGLIIGGVLWVGTLIKQALFPSEQPQQEGKGRIIEHNDNRKC